MASSIELRNQRRALWEQMQALNERAEAESRNLTAEEQEQWARMNLDLDAFEERIQRQELLERSPAAGQVMPGSAAASAEQGAPAETPEDAENRYAGAFRAWVRAGGSLLGVSDEHRSIMQARFASLPLETRALSVGADNAGGYLVPDDFRRQIESAQLWYGGMRDAATIITTDGGNDLIIPTDNDTANVGELVGENQAVTEQDTTVGQRVLRAYFYSSKEIRVPYTLLQDAAFDIETWLANKLGERIGRITNTHFTSGNGPDRPTGIIQDSVAGVTAASATDVTVDELIQLEHSVDRAYRNYQTCRWMCNDTTLRILRQKKDGDGRYIWQPGMTTGNPNTLFGYQYVVNNDLANMAASSRSILFGDFSKYLIRDVRGFTMIVLRERHAENLQVAFIGYSRTDGKLIDAGGNPVKHLAN